ncbi:MAG: hypothetical protein R3B98_07590 [Hyphomonas sp.]
MEAESEPAPREAKLLQRRAQIEQMAFIAQIVSAIAVVVSLIFVGIQLRKGNTVTLRNESNAAMAQWSSFRGSIYADRDTAGMFEAGMTGDPPLDPVDHLRFLYLMREHAWATFQIWDRAKRGVLPTANFEQGAAPDFLRVICTPGGARVWDEIRDELPPAYVADMERVAKTFEKDQDVRCFPGPG